MKTPMPINFMKWINDNRDRLKPPVGNQQIWEDREFMVTVVGGPNARTDYHINQGEEFFYQIEGNMILRVLEKGKPVDIPINEGEIFLLPPKLPHSPQRPAGTVGLVIERKRLPKEKDSFLWLCPKCGVKMYQEFFHLKNLVTQLPPIFDRFYKSHSTCKKCGTKVAPPNARKN